MRSVSVFILALFCAAVFCAGFGGAGAAVSRIKAAAELSGLQGQKTAQAATQAVTYAEVSPIFSGHCLTCHSGAKPPDGLRLDSYANIMAGSKEGKVVVPGAPDKSDLVKRIKGVSKPRMPKNGPPWLSDSDIGIIEKWIAGGAVEGPKS